MMMLFWRGEFNGKINRLKIWVVKSNRKMKKQEGNKISSQDSSVGSVLDWYAGGGTLEVGGSNPKRQFFLKYIKFE